MGKAEVGTPKYIANKMKAKGLQKLRWYCQMCEKQCRDENGFKCHTTSESHQRQLLLFADNPHRFMDEFSRTFEREFLTLLKLQFGTKRVQANKVYQEYISDRKHLHMNATQWETLTDFVKWLGKQGKCIADETEKGWFITYIDRDPEMIKMQEQQAKKKKMEKDDEEDMMDFIQKQIRRGKKEDVPETKATELLKSEEQKLTLQLKSTSTKQPDTNLLKTPSALLDDSDSQKSKCIFKKPKEKPEKRTLTALEEIIKEEEERKRRKQSKLRETSASRSPAKECITEDPWLQEGIVVKIITRLLGDEFHGKKGIVSKVIDDYAAVVRLFETNKKLKLDQQHLQTVIPNIGKRLRILRGKYGGALAELLKVNIDSYSVNVKIISPNLLKGKIVNDLAYEDVSKVSEEI